LGQESPKLMRLLGNIQGHNILILVDSGSSHTFINTFQVAKLQGVSSLDCSVSVKVASGLALSCHSLIQDAE
jgi:predicted aspartyl protease